MGLRFEVTKTKNTFDEGLVQDMTKYLRNAQRATGASADDVALMMMNDIILDEVYMASVKPQKATSVRYNTDPRYISLIKQPDWFDS